MPEYRVVEVSEVGRPMANIHEFRKAQDVMNRWARAGWTVVSTTAVAVPGAAPRDTHRCLYITFMKP